MESGHTRKIIHIDMDCFYAAVEARDRPELRGKPLAVGGSPDGRGVVATCSYEARRFGVHSAMPMGLALRKCPDLIIVPSRMAIYRQVSQEIQAIFSEYTDLIEPLSLDEAFLDVSQARHLQGSATRIAEAIRARIRSSQSLTASAGVAPNKFLAKVASDWRKPDGLFVIHPQRVDEFVRALPVNRIPGVGQVTAARLAQLGIRDCADLQTWQREALVREFGKFGRRLHDLARGIDPRPVNVSDLRKSLSVEDTFSRDLPDLPSCLQQLPALYQSLQQRLERAQRQRFQSPKSLFVKLRFHDFHTTTVQTSSTLVQKALFAPLIEQAWERGRRPVRLLGIGVQFAEPGIPEQLQLFTAATQPLPPAPPLQARP
ncbi:MAG: DNA polymerase IV [Thiolinea sp.]